MAMCVPSPARPSSLISYVKSPPGSGHTGLFFSSSLTLILQASAQINLLCDLLPPPFPQWSSAQDLVFFISTN